MAAILFPVFARAREKARQSSCLSNVKQIMLAVHMYAQDYDETLPVASHWPAQDNHEPNLNYTYWYESLEPYMKNEQIMRCPSMPNGMPGYGWNYQEFGYYSSSGNWYYHPHTPLAHIEYPASTILLGDCEDESDRGRTGSRFLYRRDYRLPSKHNGGGNMGFCDGHAKWLQESYMRSAPAAPDGCWREN